MCVCVCVCVIQREDESWIHKDRGGHIVSHTFCFSVQIHTDTHIQMQHSLERCPVTFTLHCSVIFVWCSDNPSTVSVCECVSNDFFFAVGIIHPCVHVGVIALFV